MAVRDRWLNSLFPKHLLLTFSYINKVLQLDIFPTIFQETEVLACNVVAGAVFTFEFKLIFHYQNVLVRIKADRAKGKVNTKLFLYTNAPHTHGEIFYIFRCDKIRPPIYRPTGMKTRHRSALAPPSNKGTAFSGRPLIDLVELSKTFSKSNLNDFIEPSV
jgi:hypothetical protein